MRPRLSITALDYSISLDGSMFYLSRQLVGPSSRHVVRPFIDSVIDWAKGARLVTARACERQGKEIGSFGGLSVSDPIFDTDVSGPQSHKEVFFFGHMF